jgi:hypothetical protein
MDHDEPALETDAMEQCETPEAVSVGSSEVGEEKPEADALEQAHPVDSERVRVVSPGRDDVPEADWLEQSVVEPLDEDELR